MAILCCKKIVRWNKSFGRVAVEKREPAEIILNEAQSILYQYSDEIHFCANAQVILCLANG